MKKIAVKKIKKQVNKITNHPLRSEMNDSRKLEFGPEEVNCEITSNNVPRD